MSAAYYSERTFFEVVVLILPLTTREFSASAESDNECACRQSVCESDWGRAAIM